MIPPPFDYQAPTSVSEALAILGKNPKAKILAGGQSLIPMMRFRLASPAMLVDLNRISELSYIKEGEGWLRIGAMTRETDMDRSDLIAKMYPLLADTTHVVADPLVRNLSTLGGNLAHADPANDHPATMIAYRAELVATGPKGNRTIPATEFFTGPFETALAANELLTEIRIPAPGKGSGGAYVKLERKVGDFATAAVAVQVS
ncbi:MAG: FAD binding domain-containing protein, partial [Anaerolineales bacterium]